MRRIICRKWLYLNCGIKHLLASIFICMPSSLLGFCGEKQWSNQIMGELYCHLDEFLMWIIRVRGP